MIDRGYRSLFRFIYLFAYLAALNLAYFASAFYYFGSLRHLYNSKDLVFLLSINILWVILARSFKLYKFSRQQKLFISYLQAYALLVFYSVVFYSLSGYSNTIYFILYIFTTFPVFSFVFFTVTDISINMYSRRNIPTTRFVVVGLNSTSAEFVKTIREDENSSYHFMGYFDNIIEGVEDTHFLKGDLSGIRDFLLSHEIEEVFCSVDKLGSQDIIELVNFCDNHLIRVRFLPEFFNKMSKRSVRFQLEYSHHVPVLSIRREPLESITNQIIKRVFDIVFSFFVVITVMSWLVPVIAIIIKLTSRGPVFFLQERSGRNNEPFKMIKFRSMRPNVEADTKQATKHDPRITTIGRIMRKTSLDELPNFFNVIIGKMSVVGPRPHMLKHTEDYSRIIDKFLVRQFGKPGITGLAQVNGFRGETEDPVKMLKRVEYDVLYLENWTFGLDIEIILKTLWQVLTKSAE